jgi:hypothetical protein
MNRKKGELLPSVLNYFVFGVMKGDRDNEEDGAGEGKGDGDIWREMLRWGDGDIWEMKIER